MPSFPNRVTPPHIVTLTLSASIGPLAMNMFLPSLPGMARYFAADYSVMQLTVTLYLFSQAFIQLFIGPASDRFGRRPVMLFSLITFVIGTIVALFAPTIEVLLFARVLQAFAAGGMVLARAMVRDTVATNEAASKIAYITMGMAFVPTITPVIGGMLDVAYGWQASFITMLAFGILSIVLVWIDLGETNRVRSSSMAAQFRSYPELLTSRRFWGYSATAAFTTGTFFAFLGGGPFVATEILGLGPAAYGFYFGIMSMGYIIGNFLSGRYTMRLGVDVMMLSGNALALVAMIVSLILFFAGFDHPLSLFLPAGLVGVGNGLALPSTNAGIVSVRPHLAGSASGLGGALQIAGGAALSVMAGLLISRETGPYPLLWLMVISSFASVLTSLYVRSVSRRQEHG
ncbi:MULTISPECIES: multidrug effflux MFS transporter [unclassified Aminobacter]|uniref:multidrug effflux MFS transporter n=1 Tax=unclassified Aminobacter TaxID=2644704 RepID=UPI000463CDCC|nr:MULTISPECIES: multidrug effflux MFS transporter [unclassified Aminobacter]TWG53198.1 DHA1 family bicyclomycin/chloramphenicol resistance-like MFS transporter [Aminobacter sp. J44]TWH25499.1 DHA1 family bicyclomycin/chloramphenicol resistance-like MFS transporter [Aminobacter sp. J15]